MQEKNTDPRVWLLRREEAASSNRGPLCAGSLIRDMDMAKELMELIKANILAEAGMFMLAQAQANVSIEGVRWIQRRFQLPQ